MAFTMTKSAYNTGFKPRAFPVQRKKLPAPGAYVVQIEAVKYVDAKDAKFGNDLFIVEGKVIESDHPEIKEGDLFRRVDSKKKGEAAEAAFNGNITRMIAVHKGIKAYKVTEEMVNRFFATNELAGVTLGVFTSIVPDKEDPSKPRLYSNGEPVAPKFTWARIE